MKGYIYIILASIALGTLGMFVKFLDDIHITSVIFWRVFFGFIALLIITRFTSSRKRISKKKDYLFYLLIGFVFAIAATLLLTAYSLSYIQEVVLINYTFPFMVLVLAAIFLQEKITTPKIVTAAVAFVGLIIMNPLSPTQGDVLGNIIAFFSAFAMAVFVVLLKEGSSEFGLNGMMWVFLFASGFLLLPALYFGLSFSSLEILVLYGFLTIGFCYGMLELGMKEVEADMASITMLIVVPFVAFLTAIFVIGEPVSLRAIIGGVVLISSGIILNTYSRISCLLHR